jgi:hypothetical protein
VPVGFIRKIYHDFRQTIVDPKISRVFQAPAVEFDAEIELCGLLFNEEKVKQSAGF